MIAFLWHSSCTMDPRALTFNVSQSVRSDNILHVLWHGLLLYSFISLNINPPSESLCGLRVYIGILHTVGKFWSQEQLNWSGDYYWTGQVLHILVDICSSLYSTSCCIIWILLRRLHDRVLWLWLHQTGQFVCHSADWLWNIDLMWPVK